MKTKKGQAVVEIALALPILAFLLCGITDFGRILYAANTINMVSQEAARYASFNKTNAEVKALAKSNCSLSNLSEDNISITPGEAPRASGTNVKVYITYNVNYITPLMQSIIGESFTVSASSTIRVE